MQRKLKPAFLLSKSPQYNWGDWEQKSPPPTANAFVKLVIPQIANQPIPEKLAGGGLQYMFVKCGVGA